MKVELLRKDSGGIAATFNNADHHAQNCIPLIKALQKEIPKLDFEKWVQGNSVHMLVTKDGRKFDLVGYVVNNVYQGIELRLRLSRSNAVRLAVITSLKQIPSFVQTLKSLAVDMPDNERRSFKLAA